MTPFYTILTNYGKTALAEALAAQQPLEIPYMAVGDGGGEYYEPTEAQTNLRNEQWRGELNDLRTDEELQGQVIAEAIIPHDIEGDWTVREIGLFDVKGGLIAVGKYPEIYIPSAFSGAKNQVYINIIIKVDNVAAVQLIVDHGQVLASKQYVYEHGDAKLRADLKKESGANLISFKPNEVSEAVSLSVYDILHDGLTVKNFGAKGDWNAIDQIGSDDSAAFKKYAAYINTLQNPRKGGARIMRIPAGSYRLDGFKITQEIPYWSFNMIGEGQLTQLWFNPKGEGILLENENSRFINITLNGKLNPTYPSQEDPAIPYIVKAKLANKLFDVDLTCQGVDVMWYHCFAKVSGRGFVFESGSVGMGGGGGLCEIACDDDLMIAGDGGEAMHSIESVMRHFKVSNCRFDVNSRIFRITGKHPVKEYINGLTVSDCEITLGNSIVSSDDCRLVSPVFSGNFSIASFKSSNTTAVIDVPRAINVKDLNNTWNNYTNPENIADEREKGISYVHRYIDVDGLVMSGTTAKDLVFGVVRATGVCRNIFIGDNLFPGFGDLQQHACVLEVNTLPEYVNISDNTFKSKTSKYRKWLSLDNIQSSTIQISGNNCDPIFFPQGLTFTPQMIGANGTWSTHAEYKLESGYIVMDFICSSSNCTTSTGDVKISLPAPPRSMDINLTNRYAGTGMVANLVGFDKSGFGSVTLFADPIDNALKVQRMSDLKMAILGYADRKLTSVSISGSIRYKI